MEQQFAPALGKIQDFLEAASREISTPIRCALIGGLAVSIWGVVRATEDIDLLADSDPSPLGSIELRAKLKNFLERQRCRVDWRVGEYDDPIPLLLRIELPQTYGGLRADILWVHKRWQQEALERKITVKISRRRVHVLHPEDLVLMKLSAGGPQDLLDVQKLLAARPRRLNARRLKKTAYRLRLGRALEECLRASKKR